MKSMEYIINGRIPSKKNETRKGKYGNFYNSKQTELDAIIWQLKSQKKVLDSIVFCGVPLEVFYYINTHSKRQDMSNILASIDDCLEKAEIIGNDRQIQKIHAAIDFDNKRKEYALVTIKAKCG